MREMPVSKNPLFNGVEPLDFDDKESLEFDESQSKDKFMSTWMLTIEPHDRYKSFSKLDDTGQAIALSHVKKFYGIKVYNGDWTERKYVEILDSLFKSGQFINEKSLNKHEEFYNKKQERRSRSRSRGRL